MLFVTNTDLVWGLIASFFIGNLMLLVLNLPLVGLWVKLLKVPQPWLYAGILVFAAMGTLAANPSTVELALLVAFGVCGYLMRCWDYPRRADDRRTDPRPHGGEPVPARAADQPRRRPGVLQAPELGNLADTGLVSRSWRRWCSRA